MIQSKQIN